MPPAKPKGRAKPGKKKSAPRPTGRPLSLTPAVQTRIVEAVKLGATYALAAQYGGVDYTTMRRWIVAGEADGAPPVFRSFCNAIKDAEGQGVVGLLTKIEEAAATGNWQAAAWKLERRYPADYGRRVQEVTGKDGGAIQHAHELTVRFVDGDEGEA